MDNVSAKAALSRFENAAGGAGVPAASTDVGAPAAAAETAGRPKAKPKAPSKPQSLGLPQAPTIPRGASADRAGAPTPAPPLPQSPQGRTSAKGTGKVGKIPTASTEPPKKEPIMKSSEIQAFADDALKKAEDEASKLSGKKDLATVVGEALLAKSSQDIDKTKFITELMKQWDPNRDGTITKMEFRGNIRKLVPDKVDVKDIDKLFDRFDADKSGEMDIPEVKAALKKLQDAVVKASGQSEKLQAAADKLRKKAEYTQQVANITKESERAQQEKEDMRTKVSRRATRYHPEQQGAEGGRFGDRVGRGWWIDQQERISAGGASTRADRRSTGHRCPV